MFNFLGSLIAFSYVLVIIGIISLIGCFIAHLDGVDENPRGAQQIWRAIILSVSAVLIGSVLLGGLSK